MSTISNASIKISKANCMSPFFFQKYWHIVDDDVTKTVLSILTSGHFLHKMNHTHIVLIPKKNDPKYVFDYCMCKLNYQTV